MYDQHFFNKYGLAFLNSCYNHETQKLVTISFENFMKKYERFFFFLSSITKDTLTLYCQNSIKDLSMGFKYDALQWSALNIVEFCEEINSLITSFGEKLCPSYE